MSNAHQVAKRSRFCDSTVGAAAVETLVEQHAPTQQQHKLFIPTVVNQFRDDHKQTPSTQQITWIQLQSQTRLYATHMFAAQSNNEF
jgi:hypothetical protein